MSWEKKPLDSIEVRELSEKFKIDLLVSSILLRRGIKHPRSLSFFLEEDLRFLHNPYLFAEMIPAVDRINRAIDDRERILVFGDRDVDGITSTVLLVDTLRGLGALVDWDLPVGDEQYGLTEEVIQKTSRQGVRLLITVDCGVSNIREIGSARSLGIDTIVVDHHSPQESLPECIAILNPKIEESGYPFKDLSGCGVASKLCWALGFSRTSSYKRAFCLLNIRPLNESYVIDCVRIVNLLEVARTSETLVPGIVPYSKTRTFTCLKGCEVYFFDKESQLKQLSRLFPQGFDLDASDLRPLVEETFPDLNGGSLLRVREKFVFAKYAEPPLDEIGMLKNLFTFLMLEKEGITAGSFMKNMDLVALSILADVMPLVDENRVLVAKGVEVINKFSRAPLRELLLRRGLAGRKIRARDVSWHVTPILNASGRMGEPDKAVRLLLSDSQQEIGELVAAIMGMNKKRKKIEDATWEKILPKARDSFEVAGGKFVLVSGKAINRGITGILAARLVSLFRVPSIVVSVLGERAVGSLRSPQNMSMDMLEFLTNFKDILFDFGGHKHAAGFTLPCETLPAFEDRFYRVVDTLKAGGEDEPSLQIDAELPLSYLTPAIWKVVELFEPYGEKNPPLTFLSRGMRVLSVELFGKQEPLHMKILLDAYTYKWPAILWNGSEKLSGDLQINDRVDVAYRVSKNFFQGQETLQMVILDIKK